MILFPAIDLIGGKVVRLERGDRSRCKVYSDDPVAVARSFAEQDANWVHVVDLSAAFGEDEDACAANSAAIKAICGVDGLSVDVGGGVRSLARIDELAGYGARRIALGTVLVTEPGFAEVAAQGFGELLVADIAARDGQVKVNGWSRHFPSWLRAASRRSTTSARWPRWARARLKAPLPAVRSTRATLRWYRRWPPPEGRSSPCLPSA